MKKERYPLGKLKKCVTIIRLLISYYDIGHPQIIKFSQGQTNQFDISKYFGLVTCKVLPPNILHLPVLPQKFEGKLCFSLCNLCITTNNTNYCEHTVNERSMIGTWGTPELTLALRYGYKILR